MQLHHVAVIVSDLERSALFYEQADVTYTMSRSGRAALFCRDPDGNTIELIQSR